MPRYLVERALVDSLELPSGAAAAEFCGDIVEANDDVGVSWVHSFISDDRRVMVCVYDAPNPESIRRAADRNRLPIHRITRVTVLDPYAYVPRATHGNAFDR